MPRGNRSPRSTRARRPQRSNPSILWRAHPAVALLPRPHLRLLRVGIVVVAEEMQDPVNEQEPQLGGRILGVVAPPDGRRAHTVTEQARPVLIDIVQRE